MCWNKPSYQHLYMDKHCVENFKRKMFYNKFGQLVLAAVVVHGYDVSKAYNTTLSNECYAFDWVNLVDGIYLPPGASLYCEQKFYEMYDNQYNLLQRCDHVSLDDCDDAYLCMVDTVPGNQSMMECTRNVEAFQYYVSGYNETMYNTLTIERVVNRYITWPLVISIMLLMFTCCHSCGVFTCRKKLERNRTFIHEELDDQEARMSELTEKSPFTDIDLEDNIGGHD